MNNNIIKAFFALLCFAIAGNAVAMDAPKGKRERSPQSEEENSFDDAMNKKPSPMAELMADFAKKWKHARYKHLYRVIERGNFNTAKSILGNSVLDLDALIGPEKTTFLHRAAYRNRLDIAKLLIEKGASVDVQMENGKTALDLAAERGHEEMIFFLVDHGAHVAKWVQPQPAETESDELAMVRQSATIRDVVTEDDLVAMDVGGEETEDDGDLAARILDNLNK